MSRARSQSLVIDASVARAAGPEDAVNPTSRRCRFFLLAVLDVCHRAIFSQAIAAEWQKHQSVFARQWRRSMFARKKIDQLDVPVDADLRDRLAEAMTNEKQRQAILKDAHLVEAALVRGMRIAALDETVRAYFRTAAVTVRDLRKVCWVNPDREDENPLGWLHAGAIAEDHRMLHYVTAEE